MHHLASLQVKISYQSVSYCTRKRPCFHVFIFVLQSQIISNTAIIHCFQLFFTVHALDVFIYFSAVPNRFKYLQSACFKDIVFKMFSVVRNRLNTVRMHALEILFSKTCSAFPNRFKQCENECFRYIISKNISVVLNRFKYVRLHVLETLV